MESELDKLRAEVAELRRRVSKLEARRTRPPAFLPDRPPKPGAPAIPVLVLEKMVPGQQYSVRDVAVLIDRRSDSVRIALHRMHKIQHLLLSPGPGVYELNPDPPEPMQPKIIVPVAPAPKPTSATILELLRSGDPWSLAQIAIQTGFSDGQIRTCIYKELYDQIEETGSDCWRLLTEGR